MFESSLFRLSKHYSKKEEIANEIAKEVDYQKQLNIAYLVASAYARNPFPLKDSKQFVT